MAKLSTSGTNGTASGGHVPGESTPAFETLESRLLLNGSEALNPLAHTPGTDPQALFDAGVRAVEWQETVAYAAAGQWILGLDRPGESATEQLSVLERASRGPLET